MSVKIEQKIKGYSVVTDASPPATKHVPLYVDQPDRRIKLTAVPVPLADSLRWEKQPYKEEGSDGRTYMIASVDQATGTVSKKFGVLINHHANGSPSSGYPYECWALGDKAPRGLSVLCKSLSMDMRSQDRGFLKLKLDAIGKTKGDAFDMTMPDGVLVRMPSETAAVARIIAYRCEALGAFEAERMQDTPVVDALMSKKEPKTTAEGAPSWSWDVKNPATGDDFYLTLKQVELDDGRIIPVSVWMAGEFPDSFNALCKSISFDMRVNDLGWTVRKLKQLLNVKEDDRGMMAPVPGSPKSQWYGSTIAYVAALILHHYKALGLLYANLAPVGKSSKVVMITEARPAAQPVVETSKPLGRLCTACDAYAVIRLDGCDTCASCGNSKCSG